MSDLRNHVTRLANRLSPQDPLRTALFQALAAKPSNLMTLQFELMGPLTPDGDGVEISVAHGNTGAVSASKTFRAGNIARVMAWMKDQYQGWVSAPGRTRPIAIRQASWDSSVLGLTPSDLEDMEPDEKKDAARDLLNQAGDLAEAVAEAFSSELGAQKSEVVKAAKALQQAARKVPR